MRLYKLLLKKFYSSKSLERIEKTFQKSPLDRKRTLFLFSDSFRLKLIICFYFFVKGNLNLSPTINSQDLNQIFMSI